jgi:hypothetical protein
VKNSLFASLPSVRFFCREVFFRIVVSRGMATIEFRKFQPGGEPNAGELWIRPARDEDHGSREMALLVFEYGVPVLKSGPGVIEKVVVDASKTQPTFDEMLAAEFARVWLDGGQKPAAGYKAFATYANLARTGYIPTNLPPEETLEAIFLAIRNPKGTATQDADLTITANSALFLSGWQKLWNRIQQAVNDKVDPFQQSLVAGGAEFARERSRVLADRNVYQQDVRRGERWLIQIPGHEPQSSGLLLRQPKCLLFKHWSRCDTEAPAGKLYLLLSVQWDTRKWVFSTDPNQSISLQGLAETLQNAEQKENPAAANKRWYDGRDMGHSIVGSPKDGTRLTEQQVLALVRKWASAKVVPFDKGTAQVNDHKAQKLLLPTLAAAVIGLLFAVSLLAFFMVHWGQNGPSGPTGTMVIGPTKPIGSGGNTDEKERDPWPKEGPKQVGPFYSTKQRKPGSSAKFEVPRPAGVQRAKMQISLDGLGTPSAGQMKVHLGIRGGESLDVPVALKNGMVENEPVTITLPTDRNDVEVTLGGMPETQSPKSIQLTCWADETTDAHLYVLAVGVSKYSKPPPGTDPKTSHTVSDLDFPENDAHELATTLKAQEGLLFQKVVCKELLNEEATAENIIKGMRWLVDQVNDPSKKNVRKLALVALCGHGEKHPETANQRFYFLPHDYNDKPHGPLELRGLADNTICDRLSDLDCPVVLLVDACHSGGFVIESSGQKARGAPGAEIVRDAMRELSKTNNGIILIAACLKDETAKEYGTLKHGLLTYTFLQCIKGEGNREAQGPIIYLSELYGYLDKSRSDKKKAQAFVIQPSNGISLNTIPIAVAPK